MTMRLDIVTNDAGELVRREHARELGAGVVIAIHRLVKLAQMHDLGNHAFLRQLEQTHSMISDYCLRSGEPVAVLFAHKATFVAGQLLKGARSAHEAAAELGALLERLGGSELTLAREITREDCMAFAEQISLYHRTGNAAQFRLPQRFHLRPVADSARLRGIELEQLSPDQRIMRTYASAVVVMRRFFEDLATSHYILPRRIKRIAQSLVDLSDASTASFLGVTEARNANHDEAGRAVNTAILAVSVARECTTDRASLSQIAMAAMMHDVARPRALAIAGAGGPAIPGMAAPTTLSEDQEDRLPAGAAAVLTALGRVNEPSIARTVLTFEALWLRRRTWLGAVYWGGRAATIHATIIAIARRYNDLLTPEPGLPPPTTDFAVATLANELAEPQDRTVLRMLVSAVGLLPTGTLVQLTTGEVAEVLRGARGLGDRPFVSVVTDPNGNRLPQPIEVDLANDKRRNVLRVLSVDGWQRGLANGPQAPPPGPDDDDRDQPRASAAPPGASVPPIDHGRWDDDPEAPASMPSEHPSASSLQSASMGSSPSAVAEAMGRMITDPPPAPEPAAAQAPVRVPPPDRPDRTVFDPNAANRPVLRPEGDGAREASAIGTLAATPLPHVLVYMLDHALTGSVVFEGVADPAASETMFFVNGVPAKIRLHDPIALLGEVLVEDGSLDPNKLDAAVAGANRLGILFGEYLVGHDLVSREALSWALEGQLLRKIAHVANLPPEIQYSYYRDVDLLETWGGEIIVSHPLNPILASVRHWSDRARVRATLNRIGKHVLALHPDSDLTNLAVTAEEQAVLDAIRARSPALPQLFDEKIADDEIVSSLVYSLAVTRQFAFKGQKRGPMAARGPAWRSAGPSGAPPSKSLLPAAPPASSVSSIPSAAPARQSPSASPVKAAVPPPPPPPPSAAPPAASSSSHPASQRPMPSSRSGAPPPAGGRAGAPQIRLIGAKKATIQGVGKGHVSRPPSARPAPASPASDEQRTIAWAGAPPMKRISAAPGAQPRMPKPSPAQPAATAARPGAPQRPQQPPHNEDEATDPEAAEVGDAEAALEAMTSFRLAESALQREDFVMAEEYARKAMGGDPSQIDYATLLAWIRFLSGASKPDEAIRTISKILIEEPTNEKALLYRGKILVQTNRFAEALSDFEELLSSNPHHREAQIEARQLRGKA